MQRWVAENPPGVGPGWEPYPTSLRIVNWIKWALAGHALPPGCLHSLAVQTRWLCRRLEYHLLGNHLFANAKALVLSLIHISFEHCREWVKAGHQVTVITGAPNFPTGKIFPGYRNRLWQRETMDGLDVVRVWTYIAANAGVAKRTLDYLSFMVCLLYTSRCV